MSASTGGDADDERRLYFDHNATSPLRPEAREAWLRAHDAGLGNPSSLHGPGRRARHVVDDARERVAAALGVAEEEVVFTGSGTEAAHLALHGAASAAPPEAGLVVTAIEHSAVLQTASAMCAGPRELRLVPCDEEGRVAPEDVLTACQAGPTALVAVQAANNEVGSLGPVAAVGAALADLPDATRPVLFSDAVQALGRVPLDLAGWGVDLAALSAHKVGGPVGVGVLVRRAGARVHPVLVGGGQEGGWRGGTEDVAGIAAAAVAIDLAVREQDAFARRARGQVELLWQELARRVDDLRSNGPAVDARDRLPNTLNVSLPDTDGKVLVVRLDGVGLCASAGSACASGSVEPSHVLRAMGRDEHDARAGVRLSVGWCTSDDECRTAARAVEKLFYSSHASRNNDGGL